MNSKVLPEDKLWVLAIRQGDDNGLHQLFLRYEQKLRFWLRAKYRLNNADSHEVINDVFFIFYRSIAKYEERSSVFTWLCGIGKYCSSDKYRANNRQNNIASEYECYILTHPRYSQNIEREICFQQCWLKLINSIEQKHPKSECLKVLTFKANGLSIKEIAEKIERTLGATRVFMSDCRKKIENHWLKRCKENCED